MNDGLISICMANYNKAPYIKQCLDSIVAIEKYSNIEIIIVDDCSTDDSVNVIHDWIKHNPHIQLILKINKKNSGPWYTYNQAVKYSSWEYITFMDSDDFFIKETLQAKKKIFDLHKELKVIYGNWVLFENNVFSKTTIHDSIYKLFRDFSFDPHNILNSIYCKIPLLSLSTMLIKKSFLLEISWFDETILSNDWILNIKIFQNLKNKKDFDIHLTPAFAYRIYDNNISKNYDKVLILLSQVIEKYCPQNLQHVWYANVYFTNSLSNLSIWAYKKAFSSIKKSATYNFEFKKIAVFSLALIFPYKLLNIIPKPFFDKLKSVILKRFQ